MATYRLRYGRHGHRVAAEGGSVRTEVLVQGQTLDFPDHLAPDPKKWERLSPGDKPGPQGGDPEAAIQGMSVASVRELLEKLETVEAVDELEKAELANTRHRGGRKQVLEAVKARRAELQKA